MERSLVIAAPPPPAPQLVLLFHGVGATPQDMQPLGEHLLTAFPGAFVVSVASPDPVESGPGSQWYPVTGITDADRVGHVAQALPGFVATVSAWQRRSGASLAATALIGFSQGAIMALESTRDREPVAGRVVAIGGRFAQLPTQPTPATTIHLIHGKEDPVIPFRHAVEAAERLLALGGDATADVLPFVRHEINAEIASLVVERLRGYVPRRMWEEALREDPQR